MGERGEDAEHGAWTGAREHGCSGARHPPWGVAQRPIQLHFLLHKGFYQGMDRRQHPDKYSQVWIIPSLENP